MKNIFRILVLSILGVSSLFVASCDELSSLDVNVPVGKEFHVQGTDNSITEQETFCLSQFEKWSENVEDIEDVKWVTASYWTLKDTLGNVTSPNLKGNLKYTLKDNNGFTLFEKNLGNISAADYIGNAYEIELTDTQIEIINTYLALFQDQDLCFTGSVTLDNITGDKNSNGKYELFCKVELVLETTVKTDI